MANVRECGHFDDMPRLGRSRRRHKRSERPHPARHDAIWQGGWEGARGDGLKLC